MDDVMHGCFVNGIKQQEGTKREMIRLAMALGRGSKSGLVTVYPLSSSGRMLGAFVYKSENGKVKKK